MKPATPYLMFNGNCREAMEFYHACFGGTLDVKTYADMPAGNECASNPAHDKNKVMHARLTAGDLCLMASDNPMGAPTAGDTISLNIDCASLAEIQRLFKDLSAGGTPFMPLKDTFWGAHFGMLTDRFGFQWMLSLPLALKKAA